jgi:hypothetical protein
VPQLVESVRLVFRYLEIEVGGQNAVPSVCSPRFLDQRQKLVQEESVEVAIPVLWVGAGVMLFERGEGVASDAMPSVSALHDIRDEDSILDRIPIGVRKDYVSE